MPSGGTPEGGHAKRPKQVGQLNYARAAREGIRMAIVGEGYPGIQISRQNIVDIQRAICRLVDELPEEWFIPRFVDSCWAKGAAIMACQDEETGWLLGYPPWWPGRARSSRWWAWILFPPIKEWWSGFRALWKISNGSLGCQDLGHQTWRVYERKEEPKEVRLVLSIDTSVDALEEMGWRPFSGVGQAIFSLLGAKLEGNK